MNAGQKVFIGIGFVVLAIFSYFISGMITCAVLLHEALGKSGLSRFKEYWNFNFTYQAIAEYGEYKAIGIFFGVYIFAILFIVAGILVSKKKQSLHGDARFATFSDIQKLGLFGDSKNYVKRGIIIGKWNNKFLKFGGQQFVALGAPTRSGKGVGIVIPNLLHWEESAVVQDIKQECFDYTSKYRAEKLGNEVYLFNPFSLETHRYNPFSYIDMSDELAADNQLIDLANIIYPTSDDEDKNFWPRQAQNLFIGLCYLYRDLALTEKGRDFLFTWGLSVEFNFYGLLQLSKGLEIVATDKNNKKVEVITGGLATTYEFLKEAGILGDATIRRLSSYMQVKSENTQSSIMATFVSPLSSFEGETLRRATETSDFDFRDLRKKKMTIYIGITPDQLANATFLLNVFWSQLMTINTKELPQQNAKLKYACLLLMDEFTAVGRIAILQKGVSFIAGYNLRLLMIYQSRSQLETPAPMGYGKEGAQTLLTNHACQIYYAPKELADAETLSKLLGNTTVKQTSRSSNYGQSGGGSRSISETHRALMLPQELIKMDYSKEIILIDSGHPILCNKAFYYSDKVFMDKFKEIAPSLKSIEGVPNRDVFEKAILAGECRVRRPNEVVKEKNDENTKQGEENE